MATATPATRALDAAGIAFRRIEYDYDAGAGRIGMQAAQAIGVSPGQVFKTLMVEVDGRPAVAVIPADRSLSMKRAAAAFGGKAAAMMAPARAEKLTGFHTGGISPFGQKRRHPVAFDSAAGDLVQIVVNGGRRGLMLMLAPADAVAASGAAVCPLVADP
ncbi:MAG: Cys-tRNA(Pro) deacylase [Rubellimicrobium sp.]|nr:Cys-tRNA(Pro) deacylase [Rubellimicrobium sp.]